MYKILYIWKKYLIFLFKMDICQFIQIFKEFSLDIQFTHFF